MSGTDDPIHSGSTRVVPPAGTGAGEGDAGPGGATNLLAVGTRLGEFEITGLIGEGGFGIVYAAYDHLLEREVAIKEYMPSALASRMQGAQVAIRSERHAETFEAGRRSFINEAKLLAQFDHAALVKVYRFWEANGTAYMVMPYYRGTTLRGALKDLGAPPSEPWIMAMLGPLFDALETMHEANCYHRDIAPDNILILQNGRPLLLDFGAARRVIGDITQALTVILKPGFAPLEQYANGPEMRQGPWTDVYALAAVIYYCITGRAPVPSVSRMMKDTLTPASEVGRGQYSERLLAAVDHALAIHIDDRTASIAQLRDEIGDDALSAAAAERGTRQPTAFGGPGAFPASGGPPRTTAAGAAQPARVGATAAAAQQRHAQPGDNRNGGGPDVDATRVMRPDEIDPRLAAASRARRAQQPDRVGAEGTREAGRPEAPRPGPKRAVLFAVAGLGAVALAAGLAWLLIDRPREAPVEAKSSSGAVAPATTSAPAPTQAAPAQPVAATAPAPAVEPAAPSAPGSAATTGATTAPPTVPSVPPAPAATPPPVASLPPPAPPAPIAPIAPFSTDTVLGRVHAERDPTWQVRVTSDAQTVRIGQDQIRFRVRSERPGYVYLLMVGTDRSHFYLLFPNALDRDNRIGAGAELRLPRPGWTMVAGGPPGTNQFLAIVTASPRDFRPAGLKTGNPFSEFDLAAASNAYSASGASALAGRATGCTAAPDVCARFGSDLFEIREIR